MTECSFCQNTITKGTGVMYVKKDGTVYYFCSSKCKKNTLKLKREGRRQKWTTGSKEFRGGKAKRAKKGKKK